jgi:hypothetical protein
MSIPARKLENASGDVPLRTLADEGAVDLVDVPAAVVCASCGDPECSGCASEERTHASGVLAIVPWERPGLGLAQRLWSTARLSTTTSESFFGALPEGDASSALRFALLCELLAVLGLCVASVPVLLLVAPSLASSIALDPALRESALRVVAVGVPGVALAMVALHVLHGLGLDYGARRQGAGPRRMRGLRFGLYSCGWDLVTLPFGLALVAITDGLGAAIKSAPLGLTVPARASRAYLRGVHQLDETQARAASKFAIRVASAIALAGLVLVALVSALLLMS